MRISQISRISIILNQDDLVFLTIVQNATLSEIGQTYKQTIQNFKENDGFISQEYYSNIDFLCIDRRSKTATSTPISGDTSTSIANSADCLLVLRILQQLGQTIKTTDCRLISGVTFSGSSVTKINFNNTGLVGYIPPEIGNLKSLTEL
jgi:hypothetical protein